MKKFLLKVFKKQKKEISPFPLRAVVNTRDEIKYQCKHFVLCVRIGKVSFSLEEDNLDRSIIKYKLKINYNQFKKNNITLFKIIKENDYEYIQNNIIPHLNKMLCIKIYEIIFHEDEVEIIFIDCFN